MDTQCFRRLSRYRRARFREGGRDEYRRSIQPKRSRQPAGEARGVQARGRGAARLGCSTWARSFYQGLGWRSDAEAAIEDGYRLMQLTPPVSGRSIIFGEGVTSAPPGSAQGLYLAVYDIDAARADLIARGADVSEVFHDATVSFTTPERPAASAGLLKGTKMTVPSPRSAIRTATAGCSRKIKERLPGR